jgi:hypothetical protein
MFVCGRYMEACYQYVSMYVHIKPHMILCTYRSIRLQWFVVGLTASYVMYKINRWIGTARLAQSCNHIAISTYL